MGTSVWSVIWANPTKTRPEGLPEVLLRVEKPMGKGEGAGQCPIEIHECWEEMRRYGYCVSWHAELPPARQLPIETKQRIRRRNLWKRMVQKYPMFAEEFYRDRVCSDPEHYGPFKLGEFADLTFAQLVMKRWK